jgi:AraC-like DNA-binding protein
MSKATPAVVAVPHISLPLRGRYSDPDPLDLEIAAYVVWCGEHHTVARVSELAQWIGVSREHLTRRTHATRGCSILYLLRTAQVAHVEQLLRSSEPIDQLIPFSTLGDRSTFFRVFRAEVRMTPSEWRQSQIATGSPASASVTCSSPVHALVHQHSSA